MSAVALPVLRTPRLTLRPLEYSDARDIVDGVGNYDVARWLAVVPYPYGVADAHSFLSEVIHGGRRVWAICEGDGLQGIVSVAGGALGYWLARPVWGQGYGFEAVNAVAANWFADPDAGALAASCFHGNERSFAILRAAGFEVVCQRKRPARALSQEVWTSDMRLTRTRWELRQDFTLKTPRLTLRPMRTRDAVSLSALAVAEVTRNLCSIQPGLSEAGAREHIARHSWCGVPEFLLSIEREGHVIGALGLGGSPVSLTYFLSPEQWGQGLAGEALGAFLPQVFGRFTLGSVVAECFEDNAASRRVLQRLGFAETGRKTSGAAGRLEPAPVITYVLTRESLKVKP